MKIKKYFTYWKELNILRNKDLNNLYFNKNLDISDGNFKSLNNIDNNSSIFHFNSDYYLSTIEYLNLTGNEEFYLDEKLNNILEKMYKPENKNSNIFKNTLQILKIMVQYLYIIKNNSKVDPGFKILLTKIWEEDISFASNPFFWTENLYDNIFSDKLIQKLDSYADYMLKLYELFEKEFNIVDNITFFKLFSLIKKNIVNFNPSNLYQNEEYIIFSPFIQFFKHSNNPNLNIETFYNFMEDNSYIYFRSNRPISSQDNFTLNFGNYDSIELLLRYGILDLENEYDCLDIDINIEDDQFYLKNYFDIKLKIIQTNNQDKYETDKIKLFKNKFEKNNLSLLRIFFVSDLEFENNKELFTYRFNDFHNIISIENETKVLNFLKNLILIKLEEFNKKKQKIDLDKLSNEIMSKDLINICNLEEIILKNNLKFIEKSIKDLN